MGTWISEHSLGKPPKAVPMKTTALIGAVVRHAVRVNLKGASGSARSTASLSDLFECAVRDYR